MSPCVPIVLHPCTMMRGDWGHDLHHALCVCVAMRDEDPYSVHFHVLSFHFHEMICAGHCHELFHVLNVLCVKLHYPLALQPCVVVEDGEHYVWHCDLGVGLYAMGEADLCYRVQLLDAWPSFRWRTCWEYFLITLLQAFHPGLLSAGEPIGEFFSITL